MPKVMCTSLNAEHGPHQQIFPAAGFEVQVAPRSLNLWEEENLINLLTDCQAVLAGSEPYTAKVIESLPNLRVITRTGVGFDAIDLAACDKAGVVVTTTPGVNHHSVAEHTLALLFGVARGFPDNDRRVREHRWKRIAHPRIMGRTLGIVGLGRIGRAVAWRAAGLGLKILAYEPYPDQEFPPAMADRTDGLRGSLKTLGLRLAASADVGRVPAPDECENPRDDETRFGADQHRPRCIGR